MVNLMDSPNAVSDATPTGDAATVFELEKVTIAYGTQPAIADVTLDVPQNAITAFIGPSGCGKSTLLRALNRMNDLIPTASLRGDVRYHGTDLYAHDIDPVLVRRSIGMVFQKPNPFPKSIYDNVAFGLRVAGMTDDLDDRVQHALQGAALWDEVQHDLKRSAYALSGGQQQRLCIARAIATQPDTILMDEPCSALDPIATARIEELMRELRERYTIVIVTHNMQQAIRVSDRTAFFTTHVSTETGARSGHLVETGRTVDVFGSPKDQRTADYVAGRFG
ncbi:MAG: Phosphate import ATP-binding protein PstB [Thermoleophilia bacterium]|nr:Phosphate import ATP-binding protein PstB [Thermoleophilia bacterium]MCZ4496969.1 Phosphate import ATP-binding protein PstB [Thermoleophilia bacterium]